jgi:hypothetical protein
MPGKVQVESRAMRRNADRSKAERQLPTPGTESLDLSELFSFCINLHVIKSNYKLGKNYF